jgi:Ca-activated chloride channel family protein
VDFGSPVRLRVRNETDPNGNGDQAMKLEAALTHDKIRHDQDQKAHLVITLTAPPKAGEARAPICVVPVIDVSGSMAGPKLEYAKRSAYKLIDHLTPDDYCGLIAFESRIHVIVTPQKITPEIKDKLKAEVGKLVTMGGTNFAGGMLKAIELVNGLDLPSGVLHRIIMLTDGAANEGPAQKPEDIIKLLTANAGRVTASAFGYGQDVSQDFLGNFAREGKGNYAYIRDPDSALTAFGKELGGLMATHATDLVLELNGLAGHEIDSVVSDVDAEEEDVGGEVTIKIPEILSEEVRHLVLAVKLKAQKHAYPRPVNAFDVQLAYSTLDSTGKTEKKTVEAKAKAHFVKPGEERPKPIESLDKIVVLAEVIRAQIEAEEKAKKGDYHGANAVMVAAAANAGAHGYQLLQQAATHTASSVSTATAYQTNQGYLQSFRNGGTRGVGVSEYDPTAHALLASLDVQLDTSLQTSTSASFADQSILVAPDLTGGIQQDLGASPFTLGQVSPAVWVADQSASGQPGGGVWVGDLAGISSIGAPVGFSAPVVPVPPVPPPVPQTNATSAKGSSKSRPKVEKKKSSARW